MDEHAAMPEGADQMSVTLTLPDNSQRHFDGPVTGADLAADIGPGLAKAAMAVRVDGQLRDLDVPITADAHVALITARDEEEALELIRHDTAHVLAEAVQELFPDTQVTIGPVIKDGFFYDFARDKPFTTEELEVIEARMHEIVARNEPIRREVWDRDQAIAHFRSIGEKYKAEIIEDLPQGEEVSVYRHGDNWLDLCRGPHLPSSGRIGGAFKLMKVAGAYWRGDHRNEMLTRIYGTAWRDKKELKAYLHRLEEAEKRDHRRLGKGMQLFHFQEEAAGMAFWHPKGWAVYRALEDYIRRKLDKAGYKEIKTPQIVDRSLWEKSGHWDKFAEHMYALTSEERDLAVKPMNCPCHVQVFNQHLHSYRDLPLRLSEFGSCHRYEPSGAMHGLMRVRAFTQDDAHIFCTEDQIRSESEAFSALLFEVYKDLGFEQVRVKFSDRPDVRAGDDATWDRAEAALKDATEAMGLEVELNPGEGAFYGPKLEFVLTDAIGRDWQCGTLQVDFVLPERLDASYVGEDGSRHRPVMLHRAIFGSFERFIGILIEHYAGRFPLWLAPVQVVVATITSDADAYAQQVLERLKAAGLRAELDVRNEKINYKVREHSVAKVPVLLVVGKREAEEQKLSVRRLGSQDQTTETLDDAIASLVEQARMP
ncbi:threonine--tRNA ligase [Iodidimonas gelatinilytica]|uniref:Threonine--tRNA ligase n=2 Tax=Iodidimonas gelatinilytica TaxID=1236966 RepID=A0A5A7MPM4_9PROT|nr:threonine--tRNA ligase [Iodidimonas gelatinilytica]GEQ97594.1 threonine--tRNA ligase [Iodidimonas gelatinilytica]